MFEDTRVLWFCNTPSRYGVTSDKYNGGGWISSLEEEMAPLVHLGVAFLTKEENLDPVRVHGKANWGVHRRNGVSYYPVYNGHDSSRGERVRTLLFGDKKQEEDLVACFMNIVYSFRPDVIHIFGSEHLFGLVALHTDIPVVLHIQGILNEYQKVFLPPGVTPLRWLTTPFRISRFFGNLYTLVRWGARVEREKVMLSSIEYYLGRTTWDHDCVAQYNPSMTYFHGGEILRPVFYESQPHTEDPDILTIVSTISEPPYKGMDVILLTGYLLKKKGIDFRWRVFGNVEPEFFERLSNVTLDRSGVTLEGVADAPTLCAALRSCTMYVHPSYIDNSPNSLCEAQMIGAPVIATKVGGIPSLVEDGINGLLVPSGDAEALCEAIISLNGSPDFRHTLGQNGRQTAIERHDRNTIVRELLSTYSSLKEIDD